MTDTMRERLTALMAEWKADAAENMLQSRSAPEDDEKFWLIGARDGLNKCVQQVESVLDAPDPAPVAVEEIDYEGVWEVPVEIEDAINAHVMHGDWASLSVVGQRIRKALSEAYAAGQKSAAITSPVDVTGPVHVTQATMGALDYLLRLLPSHSAVIGHVRDHIARCVVREDA